MDSSTPVTEVPPVQPPQEEPVGIVKTTTEDVPDDYIGRTKPAPQAHEIKWQPLKLAHNPGAKVTTFNIRKEWIPPTDWQDGVAINVREILASEPSVAYAFVRHERFRVAKFQMLFEPCQNWLSTAGLVSLGYVMDPTITPTFTNVARVGDYTHFRPRDGVVFAPAITSNFMYCKQAANTPDNYRFEEIGHITMVPREKGTMVGFQNMPITLVATVEFTHPTVITDQIVTPVVFTDLALDEPGEISVTNGSAYFKANATFLPDIADGEEVIACSTGVNELKVTLQNGVEIYQTFTTVRLSRVGESRIITVHCPNALPYTSTGPPAFSASSLNQVREAPFIAATVVTVV